MSGYWHPAVQTVTSYARLPDVESLIAFDRKPYRVVEINPQPGVDWDEVTTEAWTGRGMPDPWQDAPVYVVLRPAQGGRREHLLIRPWAHYGWWSGLPEHYAVCHSCGELAPCREITAAQSAAVEMKRFERLASVLPGCCWSCSEPVTSRQKAFTFPGPNVWMPTAPDGVVVHQRMACIHTAERYEEDWIKADTSRSRSLLTLTCTGSLIVHGDGEPECFGAVESDCPDPRARHRSMQACYFQTHGCPRGCARDGHPGCRVRRFP